MELNKTYNIDCIELMASIPDSFCGITVTSPPYNYNLRIHSGKYTKRSVNEKTKYKGSYHDSLLMDEYFEWQKRCIEEMIRVSKHYVFYNIQMLTGNKVALFKLLGYFAEYVKEVIIWDKVYAEPAISERVLNSQFEYIIVFSKNSLSRQFEQANFERGTVSNVLRIPKNMRNGNSEIHNACFPDKLPYELIKNFSRENDIVFDPFMGTGTTAKAATVLNRNWIGSEINSHYVDITEKELQPYTHNLFSNGG